MTDVRESFPILEDNSTGAGEAAISRTEGEASAAIAGLIGFSFKDSSGNVVLPQLTADGKLPVDTEGTAGTCLSAQGEITAGSATLADVATITGALSKSYSKFGAIVSCNRNALFQLQYIDDAAGTPATTVLAEFVVGPGQYTVCCQIECLVQSTAAGTGTQEFKLQAQNLQPGTPILSNLRGTIAAIET